MQNRNVKRFDHVDTDSDFEVEDHNRPSTAKSLATLSFRTQLTENVAKTAATDDSDSIMFESEKEVSPVSEHLASKSTNALQNPPVKSFRTPAIPPSPKSPPVRPIPTEAAATSHTLKSGVEKSMKLQTAPAKRDVSPPQTAPAVAAIPTPQAVPPPQNLSPYTKPPTAQPAPLPRDDATAYKSPPTSKQPAVQASRSDEDEHSDDFAQQILPLRPKHFTDTSQRAIAPTSPGQQTTDYLPVAASSTSDEILVRAQLRLEERRRTGAAPQRSSRPISPRAPVTPPRGSPAFHFTGSNEGSRLLPDGTGAKQATMDSRIRRLQMENGRLQDELAFLGRENQKLRSVQANVDASEAMRLQLMVDMLRKELETKEVDHRRMLCCIQAERNDAVQQAAESVEQCETYIASAEQYKKLYSEKQKELEKVKTQLQSVMYDAEVLSQRQKTMEGDCAEQLVAERAKTERALTLVEELKKQRDNMQFLNTQLEKEAHAANEGKRLADDRAATANAAVSRAQAEYEQQLGALREDAKRYQKSLAEMERGLSAQIRDEQQLQISLQQRLNEATEELQREGERHRRGLESVREDGKRALQQERSRRAELEQQLRRGEEEWKVVQSRHSTTVTAEAESRVKKYREEANAERLARETLMRDAERQIENIEELRESLCFHQQEIKRLSTTLAQSERLREVAERQNAALKQTLEEMVAHEEAQQRDLDLLQEQVEQNRGSLRNGVIPSDNWRGVPASMAEDLEQLSDENERLTNECIRLAGERDQLLEENGTIAEELLKWKSEMRSYVATQGRSPSPQRQRLIS